MIDEGQGHVTEGEGPGREKGAGDQGHNGSVIEGKIFEWFYVGIT